MRIAGRGARIQAGLFTKNLMGKSAISVLFLGKARDWHVDRAVAYCGRNFDSLQVFLGDWGDPPPAALTEARPDCIISYLSRWIVPQTTLGTVKHAINFHPGPPEYPGYGCNNFAVYDGASQFGTTCHHMAPQIDTGPIIAVARFPVLPDDTGGTLLLRTYDYQLVLFYDVVGRLLRGEDLPVAPDRWGRQPFTRKQFTALGQITPEMGEAEVARRRKAVDVSALQNRG